MIWDCPTTGKRKLHIEESISILDPDVQGNVIPSDPNNPALGRKEIISCKNFTLELITGRLGSIHINIKGESFSALTALKGSITVHGIGWSFELYSLETLLIPAICGGFWIACTSEASALISYCA
jgi:hypothetical protein